MVTVKMIIQRTVVKPADRYLEDFSLAALLPIIENYSCLHLIEHV